MYIQDRFSNSLGGEDEATSLDPEIMNPNVNQQDAKAIGEDTAKKITNETLDNLDSETKAFIKDFQARWGSYYARLADEKRKKVAELAGKSHYDINLLQPTGNKVFNPLTEQEEEEMGDSPKPKRFDRKKVNQKNWVLLEQMKAKYANADDAEERAILYNKMYEGMAFLYLGMTPDEFGKTDWEEISLILQACVERSRHGLPNSVRTSSSSSMKDAVA